MSYDIRLLKNFEMPLGMHGWVRGSVPTSHLDQDIALARERLDLPVPSILDDLYEAHANDTHDAFGTLVHPGALKPLSANRDAAGVREADRILPIFTSEDSMICLDFRKLDRTGEIPVVVFSAETERVTHLYDDAEMILQRLGMSIPAI